MTDDPHKLLHTRPMSVRVTSLLGVLLLNCLLPPSICLGTESIKAMLSEKLKEVASGRTCDDQFAQVNAEAEVARCQNTSALTSVGAIREETLWNSFASIQSEVAECIYHDIVEMRSSKDKQKIVISDLSRKIKMLAPLLKERAITAKAKSVAQFSEKISSRPLMSSDAQQTIRSDDRKIHQAINAIHQSIWMGQLPEMQNWVENFATSNGDKSVAEIVALLEDPHSPSSLHHLIEKQLFPNAVAHSASLTKQTQLTEKGKVFDLSDQNKVRLAPMAIEWMLIKYPDDQGVKKLACRINAKYKEGRQLLEAGTDASLAALSLAIPGGAFIASTRGLLTVGTSRLLMSYSLGSTALATAATQFERLCPRNPIRRVNPVTACGGNPVASDALAESFGEVNCALELGLQAMNLPFPEFKGALALGTAKSSAFRGVIERLRTTPPRGAPLPSPSLLARATNHEDPKLKKLFAKLDQDVQQDLQFSQRKTSFLTTSKKRAELNQAALTQLEKIPATDRELKKGKRPSLSIAALQDLYDKINNHSVVGLSQLTKYDQLDPAGFCYGRALATHVEALRSGLAPSQVRKVWAVGKIQSMSKGAWSYHVATIVRGEDNKWYTIDPTIGRLVTAEEWTAQMQSRDLDGNLRIFTTTPERTTTRNAVAGKSQLTNDKTWWNTYFKDLIDSYRSEREALRKQMETQSTSPNE